MLDPSLALKEGSEVQFDRFKRFAGHDFIYVAFTFETSRTNIKRVIGCLKTLDHSLTFKEGSEVKFDRFFRFPVYGFIIACNTFYGSKCNR